MFSLDPSQSLVGINITKSFINERSALTVCTTPLTGAPVRRISTRAPAAQLYQPDLARVEALVRIGLGMPD